MEGRMEGYVFDAYIDAGNVVLWIWIEGTCRRFVDSFQPRLYAIPEKRLMLLLRRERVPWRLVSRKDFISQKETAVLELSPGISRFNRLVRTIEEESGYTAELSNADIPLEQMYFFEKDIFPLCKVEMESEMRDGEEWIRSIRNIDPDSYDYTIPPFRIATLSVIFADDVRKGFFIPVSRIILDGKGIVGEEDGLLRNFAEAYAALDADILLADDGDNCVPHLAHRISLCRIPLTFGRDPDTFEKKDGRNYFSYGRILYRKHPIHFRGRLHIDTSAFLYREGGMEVCFELARTCHVPVQRMSRNSPGSGISNLQVRYAYPDYLIPHKKNQTERYKTGLELFRSDKGGIILEPEVGFHQDIAELDFVSMYPSIMVRYNISPETLLCACCPPNVPGTALNTCRNREGLIPRILRPIIDRRKYYKRHKSDANRKKATALKWILVTCFGYQGFRHAKFGRIEAHEAINAHSRATLLAAVEVAEQRGFQVVHGIVDSLWVKKKGATDKELSLLARSITDMTGLDISIEGRYRWIVFLPSVQHTDIPVPSRFYGVYANRTFKCRGIEVRRRDSPGIVKDLQEAQLCVLKQARTREGFEKAMQACIQLLKEAMGRVREKTRDDLLITKHISKMDYTTSCAQKAITKRLFQEGLVLHPGESIRYVIRDVRSRIPEERFSTDADRIDEEAYRDLLIRSTATLFLPFGLTKEKLERLTRNEQQLSLFECFIGWKDARLSPFIVERVQRRVGEFV